jgi:hypothetical protein
MGYQSHGRVRVLTTSGRLSECGRTAEKGRRGTCVVVSRRPGAAIWDFRLVLRERTRLPSKVQARGNIKELDEALARIWRRRIPKRDAMGIHGTLFYGLDHKMQYYPTRRDEEARNPNGSFLRQPAGA